MVRTIFFIVAIIPAVNRQGTLFMTIIYISVCQAKHQVKCKTCVWIVHGACRLFESSTHVKLLTFQFGKGKGNKYINGVHKVRRIVIRVWYSGITYNEFIH